MQIRQAFKAIEYVFDRAEEYNLDTDRVVLAGESAGAYFAAFISAITVNGELYDELGIDFKYRDSFRVGSAVLLNGAYNMQNMFDTKFANMMTFMCAYTGKSRKQMAELRGGEYLDSISPVNYINADFPPCVVITGKLDPLLSEGVLFAEKLGVCAVDYFYYMGKGIISLHASAIMLKSGAAKKCLRLTQKFVFEHIGLKGETGKTYGLTRDYTEV